MTPLRQRMLEDMGIRNLADNTQLSYLQQVSLYAGHFHRSPETLGPEEVRAYCCDRTDDAPTSTDAAAVFSMTLRTRFIVVSL